MKKHNVLADDIEDNSSTPESMVDTREDDLKRLNWAQPNPLYHLISCCYSQPGPYLKRNKYRVLFFLLAAILLISLASFFIGKASSEDSLVGFYDIPLPHPSPQAGEMAKAVYKDWLASQNSDSETLPFINEILIGVSMGTTEFQRRQVMRSLQIQPNSKYNVTFKFVLGKPHEMYRPILQTENSTYGDLIILEDLPDSRELARYIKPFYFFRYLHREGLRYRYVAKMDSDAFLHIPTFWKKYYTEDIQNLDLGIITLLCKSEKENYQWPQGGFYALSWNTIELTVQLFEKIGTTTVYEDLQIARWLDLAEAKYKYVEMQPDEAYDFNRDIGVLPTAMRVHEMKDDESYTLVADCFDEQGINMERVNYWKNKNWAW